MYMDLMYLGCVDVNNRYLLFFTMDYTKKR